ncbi:MAG: bacterial Ig-like domain-containing protein [Ruminiclostridium sp.]|nr:bacterial Ig-like domain-containing protein [Ruminiclostridium sp.]
MRSLIRKITAVICSAAIALTAVMLPQNAVSDSFDIKASADDITGLYTGAKKTPEPVELSAEELESISEGVRADYEKAETITDLTVSPCTGYDHSCSYYYDQLSTKQKALWDGICEAYDTFLTSTVDLTKSYTFGDGFKMYYCSDYVQYDSSITDSELNAIFNLIRDTNPQYYFIYSYSYGSSGGTKYFTPTVISDCAKYSNRKAYQSAITSKTDEWLPKINAKTTVIEKELYICDLIKDYIEYDDDALTDDPGDWHDQSLIGVFYDRLAVCAGYAHAVTYLCNAAGIPCVDMVYEGCHEWNRVNLYGTWYETDVTWYDTGKSSQWLNRSHSKIVSMDGQNAHTVTTTYYNALGVSCPPADVDTVYSVKSISVSALPAKTTYKVGEVLDLTGGKVTAALSSGGTYTFDMTASMISGFSSAAEGTKTVTVTFDGKTATFSVTVGGSSSSVVKSIKITTFPKTGYKIGESLDVSGGILQVTYNDDSVETIPMTASMVSGFSTAAAGSIKLTVTYEGCSTTYYIVVMEDTTVTSIKISYYPKTDYTVGEALDVSGGILTVTYSDGTKETVALAESMISGFTTEAAGTYTVTVTYGGCTTTYFITVTGSADEVVSIEIDTYPKTEYRVGEPLDLTGGVISVRYADNSIEKIAMTADMISDFSTEAEGIIIVTVTYKGCTAIYLITVDEDFSEVVSISIKDTPKTVYYVGETLDVTGGSIFVTYDDDSKETIAMTAGMISGFTTEEAGTYTVTVTYAGFTASYDITVKEDTVTGIAMTSLPKTSYFIGDEIDLAGAEITVTYASGREEITAVTSDMVSGFDTAAGGAFTVTVTYKGFTDTFGITVSEKPHITGIAVADPPKTMYLVNDKLDVKGGTIKVTYSDGSTETVDMTEEMISGFTSAEAGKVTLTVTYEGFTAEYEITVTSASLLVNGKSVSDLAGALTALKNTTGAVEIIINKSLTVTDKVIFPTKASLISIKGSSRSIRLDLMKAASLTFSCPVEIDSITIKNSKGVSMPMTAKKSITLNNAEIGALKASDTATVTNSNIMGAFTGSSKYGNITFDTSVVAGIFKVTAKTITTVLNDVTITGNLTLACPTEITGTVSINGIFTPKSSLSLSGELQAGRWS